MPHPKNRLKLTGDTHLPDVGLDDAADDRFAAALAADEPRVYADGYIPPEARPAWVETPPQPQGLAEKVEQRVQELPARKPWAAIGVALAVGWMLARMLRGR